MPSFEASPATVLWDATPVSNAFLCEYMPVAPEDYVKVYLYGLMAAHSGLQDGSGLVADAVKQLDLKEEAVLAAFSYWERCRLVERISANPPIFRYINPAKVLFDRTQLPTDEAYERFAQSLACLFEGKTRRPHGAETSLAYEWVEDLKIPAEIVIMLIQFMLVTHGQYFKFKDAQKLAVEIKEKKISSVEEAEAFFAMQEKCHKAAKKVLKKLAINRDPTEPELKLYQKWTVNWGFEPDAILEATSATTAAANPTFAYLDKILEGLHDQNSTDVDSAVKKLTEDKQEIEHIREVLSELGISQDVIGEGEKAAYRGLCQSGHEMVIIAAKEVKKSKRRAHTLDNVAKLLESWRSKGITLPEAALAYIEEVKILDSRLYALNERFRASSVKCSEANREFIRRWKLEWAMPDELVELSADYAANAKDPLRYMDALLTRWHEKNILELAAAKAEHEENLAAMQQSGNSLGAQPVKKVNAQLYEQRSTDLSKYDEFTPEEIEEISKYGK